jgi:hypothetical protein
MHILLIVIAFAIFQVGAGMLVGGFIAFGGRP